LYTSVEKILPKSLDGYRRVGNFALENSLNLAVRSRLRGSRDEVTHLVRQREICFVSCHEHVRNLRSRKLFRDSFAAHHADAAGGNGIQASAIVQAIAGWLPENRVHIQKIVPQQLFDGVRSGSRGHVGVIFDAPEIEDQPFGAKPAFHATKSVGGLIHVTQYASYFIDRMCSGDDQIDVCGPGQIFGNVLKQQITKESAHDENLPGAGK